ncbi:MAG: hypothetical protein HYW48_01940 [Deltaproteobacteria bacterium]|nr:hypothetical protein [Deltaproteobacteria bacterium]
MKSTTLVLLCISGCASVERRADHRIAAAEPAIQMVGSEFDVIPNAVIDPSLLKRPDLVLDSFALGSIQAPLVYVTHEGPYSYFRYTLCPKDKPDTCASGTHVMGAKIFPTLKAGSYTIDIATCALGPDETDNCSEAARGEFIKQPNPDDELATLVHAEVQRTYQIKGLANGIYAAMRRYQDSTFKNKEPKDSFSRLILNQIRLGPILIGAMINSAQFPNAYKLLYGETLVETEEPDLDDERVAQLEARVAKLSKEVQEKTGGLSKTGAFLVYMGTPVFLTGAIISWVSWRSKMYARRARGLVDTTFNALRNIIYTPLGYQMELTRERLEDLLGAEGVTIRTRQEIGTNTIIYRTSDDRVYVVEKIGDRTLVYKKGAGLIELPAEIRADRQLSPKEFERLKRASPGAGPDFTRGTDGNYTLNPEAAAKYVGFEGRTYRKSWLESVPSFPKLTEATVISLYNNYADMKRTNPDIADAEWGKGVPLFMEDADGRLVLVEPPDAWKVRGKNWFIDPRGRYNTTINLEVQPDSKFARLYPEGTFPKTFDPPAGVVRTDSTFGTAEPYVPTAKFGELMSSLKTQVPIYTMSDKVAPLRIPGFDIDSALGSPAWKIEIALRYQEIMAKKSIAGGGDIHRRPGQTSVELPRWSTSGKYVGGLLMVLGASALVGAVAVEMTLAGSPKETLMTELKKFEKALTDLHAGRSEGVKTINDWLGQRLMEQPEGWEYHL